METLNLVYNDSTGDHIIATQVIYIYPIFAYSKCATDCKLL
jgi:hypothetical protein